MRKNNGTFHAIDPLPSFQASNRGARNLPPFHPPIFRLKMGGTRGDGFAGVNPRIAGVGSQ